MAIYEERKAQFQARRDLLVPALNNLGLTVPVMPDGGFYAYSDLSRWFNPNYPDSTSFAQALLNQALVATTPSRDFSVANPDQYLRFSFATALPRIEEALERIRIFLNQTGKHRALCAKNPGD